MTARIAILTILVLSVAACESRFNPFNWFGGQREERVEAIEPVVPLDRRQLVAEVIDLSVDPTPTGAIIRAMGLPPRQGYWEADLVEVSREEGVITYEFRVFQPPEETRVSTQRSREILAGTSLTNQSLASIRTIVVQAAQNRRSVSR